MSLDNTSHPGRPGLDELVPSRYALRVGEFDVLVPFGRNPLSTITRFIAQLAASARMQSESATRGQRA